MSQQPTQSVLTQANLLISAGDLTDAIKLLYQAVQQYPHFYQGWLLFSKCLFEVGHKKESVQIAQHADSVDPLKQDFQRIQQCMQHNQLDDAASIARQMLHQQAHHPKAIFTLASIALTKNTPLQSIDLLEQAVAHLPANVTLRKLLTDSYVKAGYFARAIANAKVLAELDECFDTLSALIDLLFKYGQYGELLEYCQRAGAHTGNDKQKQSLLDLRRGQTLRIMGRRNESIDCLQSSLQANPRNAEAWWALADFKNYDFSAEDRLKLESLLQAGGADQKNPVAAFAYAKLSEAESSAAQTMALYKEANRLVNCAHYQPAVMQNEFAARMKSYSQDVLAVQANQIDQTCIPIFIVGLPRSGSTLIEQMLASHSKIEGTIEQPTLPSIERRAHQHAREQYNAGLSDAIGKFSAAELSAFGQAYLDDGALFRSANCRYFTDKQPFNFRLIGLIHKILPHAVIIDVRRNPMDCGLSLYKQYFHSGVDFSYNLSHIGAAYNAYVNLMEYWSNALPGKVLTVQYEALVRSPQQQIEHILHHIGLSYEQNCLDFHNTERAIHTASSEQVREPINARGIGAWESVAAELSELEGSLSPAVLAQRRF
ncbi:tetratricopeptide repeat-containing sulfotransferase family protein [Alteromonas gilva]|uniref:Sulfotransferase n=1 Tax=Alteromonas gilva TaxID=2987522 RepID=A0ABT5L6J6_9ALTE|nr:tetratricopeptide repeat-containing sulfotransferase family protein [Alteromonas gilva]MDC8831996.1 sulfotransferase [Alteromonas gilva]